MKSILVTMLNGKTIGINAFQIAHVANTKVIVEGELRKIDATMIQFASGRKLIVTTPIEQVLAQVRAQFTK